MQLCTVCNYVIGCAVQYTLSNVTLANHSLFNPSITNTPGLFPPLQYYVRSCQGMKMGKTVTYIVMVFCFQSENQKIKQSNDSVMLFSMMMEPINDQCQCTNVPSKTLVVTKVLNYCIETSTIFKGPSIK